MQSSVGSCSPGNSNSSSEFYLPLLGYEGHVQLLAGDDPYAPGYAPDPPAPVYAPPSPQYSPPPAYPTTPTRLPIRSSQPIFLDGVQSRFGCYPVEVLEGSDPLEFVVFYPPPWDRSPSEHWGEWSMMNVPSYFLDHLTWFAGEWHLVWGTYTEPVYRLLEESDG